MKRIAALVATVVAMLTASTAQAAEPIEWYRLAPGFLSESWDSDGVPLLDGGFAQPNPWGFYTAYLVHTNDKGQRTWRIENFLNSTRITYRYAQGSTMWLFEGSQKALLVDTAQNTPDRPIVAGQLDLVSVVKQLLGHENTGAPKADPVDFEVAITHAHGDHTGKAVAMAPRKVYFPDGDWPNNAPAHYASIREGGGVTARGTIAAAGVDLGHRYIEAVNQAGHTIGSTGYLDRENKMLATGDAYGSAYVYGHGGTPTSSWVPVMERQLELLRAQYPGIALFPAHFYQIKQFVRGRSPLNGRPLDLQYFEDQFDNVKGVLDGTKIGEPYREQNRNVVWTGGASARYTYSLANLYPGGIFGGNGEVGKYHAITIPGSYKLAAYQDANPPGPSIDNIRTDFYLIRDHANTSMYLIKGSTKALLVGTGDGSPGIADFAKRLAGDLPLEVVVTSHDRDQIGGLSQFAGTKVYVPRNAGLDGEQVGAGNVIDLGLDSAGRPARIEVHPLLGHSKTGITLLSVGDRVLLAGDALGEQFNGGGLVLHDTLATFDTALKAWRTKTDGRYDVIYTAHNYQWFTSPAYVDQVQQAVTAGLNGGPTIPSVRPPGYQMLRSTGAADIVASIVLAEYAETTTPGSVGGTVPATLSLSLGTPASFGPFTPGVDREYTTSSTANVISTAGDAALTVSDPGVLTNGAFALGEPLRVEFSKAAWTAPVSNDPVTITFRQHINANQALRTGTYSRTLTFTLSTTTP